MVFSLEGMNLSLGKIVLPITASIICFASGWLMTPSHSITTESKIKWPSFSTSSIPLPEASESKIDKFSLREPPRISKQELTNALQAALKETHSLKQIRMFSKIIDRMDPAQLKETLSLLEKETPPHRRQELLSHFVTAWADIDSPEALRYALHHPDHAIRTALTPIALNILASIDLQAALSTAKNIQNEPDRSEALFSILIRVAPCDIAKALQIAEQEDSSEKPFSGAILQYWLQLDPSAVAQYALSRQHLNISSIMEQWVDIDPLGMGNFLLERNDPSFLQQNWFKLIHEWPKTDHISALNWAQKIPDKGIRAQAIQETVRRWANKDIMGASNFVSTMPTGNEKDMLISLIIARWSKKKDPESAIAWAQKNPSSSTSPSEGLRLAYQMWSNINPAAAAHSLLSLSDREQYSLLDSVLQPWASKDHQAALLWAQQLQNQDLRKQSIQPIITEWAKKNPLEALQWSLQIPDKNIKEKASSAALIEWGRSDAQSAATWISNLPAGELKDRAIPLIAFDLTKKDSASASEWLNNLPAGRPKDQAIRNFLNLIMNKDPEVAVIWAESIQDPKIKSSALFSTLISWLRKDPKTAETWIQKSTLSETVKKQLLSNDL